MKNLLYIIITLIACGCSYSASETSRQLDRIESLMQSDPSAAMHRLNQFNVAEFPDSATMARWALLYSEALVTNRIAAPTDTIVDIAVNYYKGNSDVYRHACSLKALLNNSGDNNELATALYMQKEKEFLLYKARVRTINFFWIFFVTLLAAVATIVWLRQRLRLQNIRNENLISEAFALREGLTQNKLICSGLQAKLGNQLSNRFDTIDQLCQIYYESQGTKTEKKAIADKVKSQIDNIKSDNGLFADMEHSLNDCNAGFIDNLKRELPDIRPDDYRLLVYIACNLSNRTIAVLLGENIDVVYKRKSRLKAKITSLNTPNSSQFISVF